MQADEYKYFTILFFSMKYEHLSFFSLTYPMNMECDANISGTHSSTRDLASDDDEDELIVALGAELILPHSEEEK